MIMREPKKPKEKWLNKKGNHFTTISVSIKTKKSTYKKFYVEHSLPWITLTAGRVKIKALKV